MAKYEKTRTYVVKSLNKRDAVVTAPKGRKYGSLVVSLSALPAKVTSKLKVGSKITLHRFSNQYTTYFAPKV